MWSKSYGVFLLVSNVSIDVRPGEIVWLLRSPMGAGKTTVSEMALGYVEARHGWAFACSVDNRCEAPLGRVAFFPKSGGLYKKQTAREAIAHMARLKRYKKRKRLRRLTICWSFGLGDAKRKRIRICPKAWRRSAASLRHRPMTRILIILD